MPRLEACLVDAYDTIVTCDFSPLRRGVPALAGIPVETWEGEYGQVGPLLNDGRMSKAEAFGHILAKCGVQAADGLVAEMVRRDQELLLANAGLFDDVLPFLHGLRGRGIKIAVVSNCTENTRPLLVATGVDALADTLVLSCEVGAAKPAPEIFRCALDRLGVTADAAVFIDDQPGFCGSGPGPSRPSARTRRCWWAGTVRACWTGCSRSATHGSRTTRRKASWSVPRSCARAPAGRSI